MFGADPSELTEAHIGQLVEQGVREAVDLDFKRDLYGSSDNEKRKFAGDSAALGNERGGVLLLGVEEDDGVATGVPGVDLNETEEARMQQIVLSNIEPHLPVQIRPIPFTDDSGRGVYALVVPPSPRRPHGVRVNAEYRYPRRDGTHTRWLSESEIADLYRSRFLQAAHQHRLTRRIPEPDPGGGPDR